MANSNGVKIQKPQFYFLLVLLAIALVLSFFVLRPFLTAFVLAAVVTVVFQPLYRKILKYCLNHEGLAALMTTIIIMLIIFTPLIFLGMKILEEASQLYFSLLEGGGKDNFLNVFNQLIEAVRRYFLLPPEFSINLSQYLKEGLNWLLNHLGALFSNFASLLTTAFIFLVTLYYLLKDGHKLKRAIINYSPLADVDD